MKRIAFLCVFSTSILQSAYADEIIAVATGDWNKDGAIDAVMITEPQGDAEDNALKIYLAESSYGRLQRVEHVENFVWGNNAMAGQSPTVKAMSNGSIIVESQNEAIGRNRWNQKITIAYRDGTFVVAGFTYNSRDTLDLNNNKNCDLNLLAGRGVLNDQPTRFQSMKISVSEWKDEFGHGNCGN